MSFVRPHTNEKPAFSKISTLESVFLKHAFSVSQTGEKKYPFSDKNGYVRKRPKFFLYDKAHECLNKLAHQRGGRKVRIKLKTRA